MYPNPASAVDIKEITGPLQYSHSTMKFGLSTILAASSLALADYNVSLVTESANDEINNKGLAALHEGAGINYLFLSNGASTEAEAFAFSPESGKVYQPTHVTGVDGPYVSKWNLTQYPGADAILAGVIGGPQVLVKNNYLTVNGSSTFYAAKNTSDPYGYSKRSYQLVARNTTNAVPLKVKLVKQAAAASSGAPSSAVGSPLTRTASASYAVGSPLIRTRSSAPGNATATAEVTHFTTYCPSPTTFTHGSSTYTVTEATTMTIEDCDCTKETSAATSAAQVASSSKNSTLPAAESTSAPAVANSGIAVKVGSAAAAIAGVAMLL